jgi:hypothetical protein
MILGLIKLSFTLWITKVNSLLKIILQCSTDGWISLLNSQPSYVLCACMISGYTLILKPDL